MYEGGFENGRTCLTCVKNVNTVLRGAGFKNGLGWGFVTVLFDLCVFIVNSLV